MWEYKLIIKIIDKPILYESYFCKRILQKLSFEIKIFLRYERGILDETSWELSD